MDLTRKELNIFRSKGFLLKKNVFTNLETEEILEHCDRVKQIDCERKILEKNGSIRSVFAPEFLDSFFLEVNSSEKLIGPARQLLDNDIYVYQTKINVKQAMLGDWWKWHRDFTFWSRDDGMIRPDVLTAMIFLDDINEFNGPMLLVPGSHVDMEECDGVYEDNKNDYNRSLIADLKYSTNVENIQKWVSKRGLVSAKGEKGTVLFFHGNILHASSNNLSPWDRNTLMITYNSKDNLLPDISNKRPEFLARRENIEFKM